MKNLRFFLTILCIYFHCTYSSSDSSSSRSSSGDNSKNSNVNNNNRNYNDINIEFATKEPTILITTLIRNKAHTLPYFFTYLEKLNYPKDRISLLFRSDHNEDKSIELTQIWLNRTAKLYHSVDFQYDESSLRHQNETTPTDWPKERFSHIIKLKEEAFEKAHKLWADYIFFLDADVFLTNPNSLSYLISYNLPIIAPMLLSEGLYSNFWCGMSDDYYYQRTEEYKEIYHNKKNGIFPVPMVHTAVLINLNYKKSNQLTFDRQKLLDNQKRMDNNMILRLYDGPLDDIIIFAISANSSGIPMYISNDHAYGYFLAPLEQEDNLHRDFQQLINIKVIIINDIGDEITVNDEFKDFIFYPEKEKITLDHIYMINLNRRPERRKKMELCFKELGLDYEHYPAVDGRRQLNLTVIERMGIEFLTGYEDPYHHRQMTMGEIGCFLSHYNIWKKIIQYDQKEVLILEDDIRFEPYFKERAIHILQEARSVGEWDLIYFGRKRLEDQDEPWVDKTNNLVHVGYSYWTLGYAITLEGAKKLVNINPLKKLIPVDEFIPIMFNRHPNDTWSKAFVPRNLKAYSAAPLLLYPTHYTGEEGYISDTEDSQVTTIIETDDVKDGVDPIKTTQLKSDKERISQKDFDSLIDETNMNSKHKEMISKYIGKRNPDEL